MPINYALLSLRPVLGSQNVARVGLRLVRDQQCVFPLISSHLKATMLQQSHYIDTAGKSKCSSMGCNKLQEQPGSSVS